MAQWSGQFLGFTHDTKVQDAEDSLRSAVQTINLMPEAERTEKMKNNIRSLAERVLAVRLKALRARVSSLTEPGGKSLDAEQASHLRARVDEVQAGGVKAILKEFGV